MSASRRQGRGVFPFDATMLRIFKCSAMKLIHLFSAAFFLSPPMSVGDEPAFHGWAERPPMGWNSWDIFGTTVTEKQIREQADAMAEHLLPSGYDTLTVDIQWYEPNAKGH